LATDSSPPVVPPALVRRLGLPGVLLLTLSVATPASSVFVIVPGMLQVAGTGAVWAMLLAGVVCVATALIYAELSSAWPVAGGEYVAVARTLGPAAGFAMLGVNVANNLLFPPVAGLGLASVLGALVPGLPAVPVAIAVVAGATLVALLDIRVNALVTGAFLAAELAALAVVCWAGWSMPVHPIASLLTAPVQPGAGGALIPATPGAIGVATVIAIFALNGYGAAVYFGEEVGDAPRRVAHATLWAVALSLLLEGAPMLAGLMGAPDLRAFLASDDPFGLIVAARGGQAIAGWVAAGVALAIVNAVIACVLACARFFYASGRDGTWGGRADRWLAAVHPRFGSPRGATLLTGAVGVVCCFLPLRLLLVLSGAGLVAIYAGIALAAVAGRRKGSTTHAAWRMPFYPLAPAVTLAALGFVIWTSWGDPDEGRPGLIATALQVAASLLYYRLVLRRRGWEAKT